MSTPSPSRIALAVRVAARFQKVRLDPPSLEERERNPHYARMEVRIDLPERDPYIQSILKLVARKTGAIPHYVRGEPFRITVDAPISLEDRMKAARALQSLPFVASVIQGTGPEIRRR
jgi:hypothetical protein